METIIATTPLYVVKDRPFVNITWMTQAQQTWETRCWLDTGGGAVIITEGLAQRLGIAYTKSARELVPALLPAARIGGELFDFTSIPTLVALNQQTIHGEDGVEVFCGAPFLSRYHLVFDYLQNRLTIAPPATKPLTSGSLLPFDVHPQSHFPRVEIIVDKTTCGMLLDTGASMTMLSQDVLERLIDRHPEWLKQTIPADTSANGLATPPELLVEIPYLTWGPYQLKNILVSSRPTGVFEKALSSAMNAPIVGALAGNVLSQFCCELDYQASRLYVLHKDPGQDDYAQPF